MKSSLLTLLTLSALFSLHASRTAAPTRTLQQMTSALLTDARNRNDAERVELIYNFVIWFDKKAIQKLYNRTFPTVKTPVLKTAPTLALLAANTVELFASCGKMARLRAKCVQERRAGANKKANS